MMILSTHINESEVTSADQDARKTKSVVQFLASLIFSFIILTSVASAQVIDIETFGTGSYPGPALQGNQTTYTYNAPAQPANFPNILMDGQYVIATDTQQGFSNWASIGDNTTGSGYMMLINADDNQSGEFYRAQIPLTANTSFDFVTYLLTANSQGDFDFCTANEGGLVLPDVTLQIEDGSGGILASLDTGPIPFNPTPEWGEYQIPFATDALTTSVELVLINNSIGGCGNDLAIDDITFRVAITMEAFDDIITLTDTSTTQSAVLILGANDTLDGNPLPGTENYTVAALSTLPSGISLNGNTGEVDVAAGTPNGTYTFDYQVCETTNMFNCSTATATIIVNNPPLPITASDDSGSVADSSTGFTPVLNVLDNDSVDSMAPSGNFDLSVSFGSSLPSALTFDVSTGEVGVVQGAPSGIYTFEYDICEQGTPTNCETATVTIDVTNPNVGGFCPAGTAAIPGTYNVVSASGGQNTNLVVGSPVAEGTTLTNSAVTFFGPITMDLTGDPAILAAEGEIIEVVLSSHFGTNGRAEILMSPDGVNYTSLGTTGNGGSVYGPWTSNVMRYDDFVVPAGGARFLQVLQQSSGVRADGVIYGTQCTASPPTDADLVTVKSLSSATATPSEGDTVTFEIEVTNDGSAEATGVSLTDLLPAGLTATAANGTVSSGTYDAGTGLWTLGALANGASATLTIEGIVDAGQVGNTLTNTLAAPASGDQPDPSTAGDDLTESVTIVDSNSGGGGFCPVGATSVPGMYNVVSASGGQNTNLVVGSPVAEGTTLTNSAVTFFGPITMDLTGDPDILAAEGEVIEVVLSSHFGTNGRAEILMSPDGVNYTSLGTTGNGGSVYGAWTSNVMRYDDFVVPAGGARFLQVLQQSSGVRADGVIYGTQCQLGAPTEVDLVTVKTLTSASATPSEGDTVTFEIEVSNNGVGEATGVTLTDLIPTGLTATGANGTVSAGSYDAGTGLWTLGALADGASATLTIEGIVDAGQGGNVITNTLASPASGDQTDPSPDGDDLTESVTIEVPAPSLSMTKVAGNPGPYTAGDVVTYTYTVVNDGDQIVRDIAITDTHNGSDPAPVPGNETLLTDAAPTGDSTDAGPDNSWDVLAPGDTVTFTGTYTITATDVVNLQQ